MRCPSAGAKATRRSTRPRTLRERRDPIVLPDEGSIQAVLDKCSPALRNLAVAARLTGGRQAELTALKWPQFNVSAGTLEIIKGKGNRRRVIALPPASLEHIAKLPRTNDLIFPSADGRWVSVPPAFAKTVRRAAPSVPFRFHDLRHGSVDVHREALDRLGLHDIPEIVQEVLQRGG